MGPYRTPCPPDPGSETGVASDGRTLAFGVLTLVAAVQVAIGVPHGGTPSAQTMFGAVCFIAGALWLIHHRDP